MSKQPGGYPRQNPQPAYQQPQPYQGMPPQAYPQAQYPQQHGYVHVPVNQPMPPPTYGVPPPPYTPTPQQLPSYPAQQMPMHMVAQPGVMPAAHGSFDAGARFHQGMPPQIPPPPPGCPPTGAQVAAAQGQSVVMNQNPSGWISGGSDGGYTVW